MTSLRRAVSVLGNVVLWAAAVLGALSLVVGLSTVVAGVQPLVFRSGSMAPAIEAGALGLARTVDAGDVATGDVVSVTDPRGVRVTHRVVEVRDGAGDQVSLTLQGDANRGPDENPYLVTEVDRVFLAVPHLGYVAHWLASPWAMFAAGIVVALLLASLWTGRGGRRPGPTPRDRAPRADGDRAEEVAPAERSPRPRGLAATFVAVVGLSTASLLPVPPTEAYFSDPSMFEAGVIHATNVTIFDLGETPCVQDGNNVKIRWRIPSSRFTTIWHRTPVGGTPSGEPIKELSPAGARDTLVETTFTRAEVAGTPAAAVGVYELVGRSKLRGSATSPWISPQVRRVGITLDATGVRCGTTNLPPTVTIASPQDSVTYLSSDLIEAAALAACGRRSPCGTATDLNGITSVEYRLQRANNLGTQCWNPGLSGYYLSGCSTWREADTTPSVPTTSPSSVTWRVPVATLNNSTYNQAGVYTLYLRVTDNASPTKAVTERTMVFTVR